MKIKFVKDNENVITKMIISSSEIEFNYVVFINSLYIGEVIENIEYEGDFSDELKEKLNEMINKINTTVSESMQIIESDDIEIVESQ